MTEKPLLREYIPFNRPTLLMEVGADPSVIETIPTPMRHVVDRLHAVVRPVFEEMRTLDQVTPAERRRLLDALERVAGCRVAEYKIIPAAHRAREVLDWLGDEFVLSEVAHQYGSDGSYSDSDTFATALTAFYPWLEFGTDEVRELDRHGSILGIRCASATWILMNSAWGVGHVADERRHEQEVRTVRAYLESELFRTPPRGSVHAQAMHVRFDPSRGGIFVGFDQSAGSNTVVHKMIPRFVYNPDLDRYIRVHLEFRERKGSASEQRKLLVGRGVGDDVAFRIVIQSREDWDTVRQVLFARMCNPEVGARPDIMNGKRINGAHNGESVEDPGVLWKGTVQIPGVVDCKVELQVVLFSTWWDRNHAFGSGSDAWYKLKQWCRVPEGSPEGPIPLPPPIHLAFPPTLYPEWTDWEYIVRVLRERMLRKAVAICQTHDQLMAASTYIEQVITVFAEHPRRFKFVEPVDTAG